MENRAVFEAKVCCTRECSDARLAEEHEKLYTTPKICKVCKGNFYRRKGSETKSQFEKRETCGRECGHASRRAKVSNPKSPNGKKKASEYEKKLEEERLKKKETLPPPKPLPDIEIVWRPESWGGTFTRKRQVS